MSTSIAQLPAYKPTKTTRTKAVVDRTIFGTTLDSHDKCKEYLKDNQVVLEAEALYAARYKKNRTPTPKTQQLNNAAWGIKDFTQTEIGEEFARNYSPVSNYSDISSSVSSSIRPRSASTPIPKPIQLNKSVNKRAATALGFNPHVNNVIKSPTRRRPKTSVSVKSKDSMDREKNPKHRKSKSDSRQHFYLPPGARNYMRIASLKITETGAKDLVNSKPVNKLGFGDTQQYNYETIKPIERPEIYKNHGLVLQLGQKFTDHTTNKSDNGPGAYYKLTARERDFNARYQESLSGSASGFTDSFRSNLAFRNRRTFDNIEKTKKSQQEEHKHSNNKSQRKTADIPQNIKHKFGETDIDDLIKDRREEIEDILSKDGTDMRHSGILPPRSQIHELNHPISPPVKYYSNFGQSLRGDKFEGGLHLYIK